MESCISVLRSGDPGVLTREVASAQEKNYGDLAARIVKTSAGVKPGDVVVVAGGKHNLAVMEEMAIQAMKAGGLVTMMIDSDRLERALFTEVPENYLEQPPTYFAEWLKHMNVFIGLAGVEDPRLFSVMCPRTGWPKRTRRARSSPTT